MKPSYCYNWSPPPPCKFCKRQECPGEGSITCQDTIIKGLRDALLFNQEGWKESERKLKSQEADTLFFKSKYIRAQSAWYTLNGLFS
jgi:hypothetical protein